MSDSEQPFVFAATEVMGAEKIDGGRTLAIRLRKADGGEAVILLPLHAAQDLSGQLTDAIDIISSTVGSSKL